ncbi:MAG: hypothetical protein LQ342_005610 [Letrouitia transgressa]|nr:MAG: hypothetical protein LQ342_005610 [Letrouitia transgressa]
MVSNNSGKFAFEDIPSIDGSVAIVTGGSDGIGYITALQLALHGAQVYILSRSAEKATQAIASIKESAPDKSLHVEFIQIDLLSFASVVKAVEQFKARESTLDILINNAGIMAVPYTLTENGYETQWQTNYLSPFLLIKLLLPVLKSTAAKKTPQNPVRIVNLSSDAAFLIAPTLNLEDPNFESSTSFLGPW